MKIENLIKQLGYNFQSDVEIDNLTIDSHLINEKSLFIALKGEHFDAYNLINEQLLSKVGFVFTYKYYPSNKVFAISDLNYLLPKIVKICYPNLFKNCQVIGLIGTSGKSTTASIIYHCLNNLGKKVIYFGTGKIKYQQNEFETNNTTLKPIEFINNYLKITNNDQIEYLIVELSSHGIIENRLSFLNFDYLIYTNLGQDHLDYHQNMENYFNVKQAMFKSLPKNKVAIINIDDNYAYRLISNCNCKIITYNKDNFLKLNKLMLDYNYYNFNAAYKLLSYLKINHDEIINLFNNYKFNDGRSEIIKFANKTIIIDYAHSVNAFKNILMASRKITTKRLIVVFGCGGERQKSKRPQFGKLAKKYADIIILTNDNPRNENEDEIIDDILKGIKGAIIIKNRKNAIKQALNMANSDDIVLIVGKGNEKYQLVKNKKIPFNDKEVVRMILNDK